MELNLQDDAGGATPSPGIPTDVWINGNHEALVADGGSSTPVDVTIDVAPGATVPIQIWATDDVVTNAQFSAFFNTVPANDVCVVVMPIQQNFTGGSPVNGASAGSARLPVPTTSGMEPS